MVLKKLGIKEKSAQGVIKKKRGGEKEGGKKKKGKGGGGVGKNERIWEKEN